MLASHWSPWFRLRLGQTGRWWSFPREEGISSRGQSEVLRLCAVAKRSVTLAARRRGFGDRRCFLIAAERESYSSVARLAHMIDPLEGRK